jgi:hypothetical protein
LPGPPVAPFEPHAANPTAARTTATEAPTVTYDFMVAGYITGSRSVRLTERTAAGWIPGVADEQRPVEAVDPARPTFARDYPRDPELDAMVAAFTAGNFARVHEGAARIAASSSDEALKRASAELVGRTKADPLATLLIVVTAALLLALAAFWVLHDGPGAAPP